MKLKKKKTAPPPAVDHLDALPRKAGLNKNEVIEREAIRYEKISLLLLATALLVESLAFVLYDTTSGSMHLLGEGLVLIGFMPALATAFVKNRAILHYGLSLQGYQQLFGATFMNGALRCIHCGGGDFTTIVGHDDKDIKATACSHCEAYLFDGPAPEASYRVNLSKLPTREIPPSDDKPGKTTARIHRLKRKTAGEKAA